MCTEALSLVHSEGHDGWWLDLRIAYTAVINVKQVYWARMARSREMLTACKTDVSAQLAYESDITNSQQYCGETSSTSTHYRPKHMDWRCKCISNNVTNKRSVLPLMTAVLCCKAWLHYIASQVCILLWWHQFQGPFILCTDMCLRVNTSVFNSCIVSCPLYLVSH